MKTRATLILLVAGLTAACSPATEVLVTVDSQLTVPSDLQTVCIAVSNPAVGMQPVYLRELPVCAPGQTAGCFAFPISVTLIPGPERPNEMVRVEVLAMPPGVSCLDADAATLTPTATMDAATSDASVFSFITGQSQRLDFFLYNKCLGVKCSTKNEACNSDGICETVAPGPHGNLSDLGDSDLSALADLSAPPDLPPVYDLAGCPALDPPPTSTGNCTTYQFAGGVPDAFTIVSTADGGTMASECGRLHIHIPAGTHDFYIKSVAAARLELQMTPIATPYTVAMVMRATFNQSEQFAGIYARSGTNYISVHEGFTGGGDDLGSSDSDMGSWYQWWEVFDTSSTNIDLGDVSQIHFVPGSSPPKHLLRLTRTLSGASTSTYTASMTSYDLGPKVENILPQQIIGIEAGNANNRPATTDAIDVYVEYLLVCEQ